MLWVWLVSWTSVSWLVLVNHALCRPSWWDAKVWSLVNYLLVARTWRESDLLHSRYICPAPRLSHSWNSRACPNQASWNEEIPHICGARLRKQFCISLENLDHWHNQRIRLGLHACGEPDSVIQLKTNQPIKPYIHTHVVWQWGACGLGGRWMAQYYWEEQDMYVTNLFQLKQKFFLHNSTVVMHIHDNWLVHSS